MGRRINERKRMVTWKRKGDEVKQEGEEEEDERRKKKGGLGSRGGKRRG